MKESEKITIENRNIRRLQLLVDFSIQELRADPELSIAKVVKLIHELKKICLRFFPGKGGTFDLIYQSKIMRVVYERKLINLN